MLNNHVLKKALLFLFVLAAVLAILHIIEAIVVASVWFMLLWCLIGILLPTYLWTQFKGRKRGTTKEE